MSDSPNPGSERARKEGCTCPRYDNRHGKGYFVERDGTPKFILREDCPLHGSPHPDPRISRAAEWLLDRDPAKFEDTLDEDARDLLAAIDGEADDE